MGRRDCNIAATLMSAPPNFAAFPAVPETTTLRTLAFRVSRSHLIGEPSMGKARFITLVSASWALALLGTWAAFRTLPWLEPAILIGAVWIFYKAASSRAVPLGQTRTANWGTGLYLIGFLLFGAGMAMKHLYQLAPPFSIMMAGAGVWSIGLAWTCIAALWNGGWFVGRQSRNS